MSFMQQQVEFGTWYVVETMQGANYLPEEIVPQTVVDFCDAQDDELVDSDDVCATVACDILQYLSDTFDANHVRSIERTTGYGARLSAPGYMDCTEWSVYETEREALDALSDMYGDDE